MDLRQLMLRRALLAALIGAVTAPEAWGRGHPSAIAAWLRSVDELRDALVAGELDQAAWQVGVETANRRVPLADLVAYLDLDALALHLPQRPALAAFVDLPQADRRSNSFIRLFGMRRGANLLPHVHNGMVSAHLVVSGSFRVRTHDRLRDLDDAVVLRQTRDEIVTAGGIVTMSDAHDNQHWLVACEDRSYTLDVAVFNLPHTHRLPARFQNTLLVDPTRRPGRDGAIVAPVLSIEAAIAKFAA